MHMYLSLILIKAFLEHVTRFVLPLVVKRFIHSRSKEPVNIELIAIFYSLVLSLHCSRVLNLIADRFEANNVLIHSHGFLYKQFSVSFYSGIR